MGRNQHIRLVLVAVAFGMLGLGFASKPLYDTFCKVTGFGGTTQKADANTSEVIDRMVKVSFDSNVSMGLPWDFVPEQASMELHLGQSGLAYYKVKNVSNEAITGTATFNVTPMKAATYFVKTECFCFTEQRIEPGQEVSMPVLFYVDSTLDEEERLKDVKDITLSYTFFRVENPEIKKEASPAAQGRDALN
ncbi:MAG: cytochrome c oxidase assembly protein [Alphaproteobacteria bacterium]